jgi:outer membrane protein assembly factor BamB
MSSPVLAGDRVVGLSSKGGGTLVVIAAATGKVVWQQADASREYAAFIRAGDRVLMQTTEGKVVVFDPAAEKFETTAEYTVADDKTWAHPAFTGEALVVKDKLHLQVWKLK